MIWDRWDDAMDDIRDERYELNRETGRVRPSGRRCAAGVT
jgi:hypothetical protein